MMRSAAHKRAHPAPLMPETEGNLLTDKTCGADDEIHG
jgi:hypothetical protein